MDGTAIQMAAAKKARSLPEVTQTNPFGPDYEVFKVVGKIFMMTTEVPGQKMLTLKCDPDRSKMLREVYANITPGYHMNKRHWISIAEGEIARDLIEDLVADAYRLVVKSQPKNKRPNDQC